MKLPGRANPDRGFNWYVDPGKSARNKEAKAEDKPKTIYEMTTLEEIQKELAHMEEVRRW